MVLKCSIVSRMVLKCSALPYLPQAWDEPKYQEEGIKVCGALLAVCYNPDTQVQMRFDARAPPEIRTHPRSLERPSCRLDMHAALYRVAAQALYPCCSAVLSLVALASVFF